VSNVAIDEQVELSATPVFLLEAPGPRLDEESLDAVRILSLRHADPHAERVVMADIAFAPPNVQPAAVALGAAGKEAAS
jgi:hypothetical protein